MTTVSATYAANEEHSSRALHISLWVAQGLLGLAFLAAGAMKTFEPIETLAQGMSWVATVPGLVRFIGISELLGGTGVILPAATRIKPWLTPLAAVGLTAVMVLATLFHLSRGEFSHVPVTVVLGGLAAFVAWGRWKRAPIAER